jgi:UDP-N-acetylglucosamine transferase subunit ALG13
MILVIVGTSKRPFDRLLKVMDSLAKDSDEEIIIQRGHSRHEIRYARWTEFYRRSEIGHIMRSCRLVVSHAGIGTVLDARSYGKPIIIVPRRKEFGESLDNHQVDTARDLQGEDGIYVAWSENDIREIIDRTKVYDPETIDRSEKDRLIFFLKQLINDSRKSNLGGH